MRDLTRPASVMTAILVVWTLAISQQTAQAELLDPAAVYTASYSTVAEQTPAPLGDATTTVGGDTFDLNAFLGADRYYSHATSISGQNTISTNLEAGFFWNGHETLQHVATNTTNFVANPVASWGGASISAKYDRHATWAAMLIGGRTTGGGNPVIQQGIAPDTELRSGAIASSWAPPAYALSFNLTTASFLTPYEQTFGIADVVSSSYGFQDPSGTFFDLSIAMDAYSFQNPSTTYVTSAGNDGPASNTVGSPGSLYNTITVAALTSPNAYAEAAGFSSRGPQSFGYRDPLNLTVITPGVRAAVDLSAPGFSLVSAFYGGQNGGNNSTLTNSLDAGSNPAAYTNGISGTSFAAPLVAGGASLVASAAKTLPALAGNPAARESVVVKALLLNGADKTTGWNNGQQTVTVGSDSFIQTTQSLDWATGAGRMNLDKTFELQVNGQTDVPGTATGNLGNILRSGWDYGQATIAINNDYVIAEPLSGGTAFDATLTWLRNRYFDFDTTNYEDVAQADLNLSVWLLDQSNNFTQLIASSASLYNTVEHLSFTLPATGFYGLRIGYPLNVFDNTIGTVWGNASNPQAYAVSWQAVPEPGTLTLLTAAAAGFALSARRGRPAREQRQS